MRFAKKDQITKKQHEGQTWWQWVSEGKEAELMMMSVKIQPTATFTIPDQ